MGKKTVGGQKQGGGGFFSSIFGRKAKKEEQEVEESRDKESKWLIYSQTIVEVRNHWLLLCSGSGLDELMTPEEKEKLYTAIGYSGSSHNLALPKQVATPAASYSQSTQDEAWSYFDLFSNATNRTNFCLVSCCVSVRSRGCHLPTLKYFGDGPRAAWCPRNSKDPDDRPQH